MSLPSSASQSPASLSGDSSLDRNIAKKKEEIARKRQEIKDIEESEAAHRGVARGPITRPNTSVQEAELKQLEAELAELEKQKAAERAEQVSEQERKKQIEDDRRRRREKQEQRRQEAEDLADRMNVNVPNPLTSDRFSDSEEFKADEPPSGGKIADAEKPQSSSGQASVRGTRPQRDFTEEEIEEMLESGDKPVSPGSGQTEAARALDKHGGRQPEKFNGVQKEKVFPNASGNQKAKNDQARRILEGILRSKNKSSRNNRMGGQDVFDQNTGKGARFDAAGRFIGFLDP
jgi:hypothetical protein